MRIYLINYLEKEVIIHISCCYINYWKQATVVYKGTMKVLIKDTIKLHFGKCKMCIWELCLNAWTRKTTS